MVTNVEIPADGTRKKLIVTSGSELDDVSRPVLSVEGRTYRPDELVALSDLHENDIAVTENVGTHVPAWFVVQSAAERYDLDCRPLGADWESPEHNNNRLTCNRLVSLFINAGRSLAT